MFTSSIFDGFESYHFVVSQQSKQPKNVQFEPIIEQEHYDLLLASLCSGPRSPLPLFFCENEDERWSTPGRRTLGEDGGGGYHQTLFHFLTTSLSTFMDWLPGGPDLFLGEEGSFLVESENFVSSIVYFLDSIVVIVRSAKVLAR